jgi:dihydrofolate reductase
MRATIVVARSEGGVIGYKNRMPWNLPGDMDFFKKTTIGHPVIMGRKTFESFRKPLVDRDSIVLSKDSAFSPDGADIVKTVEQAEQLAKKYAADRDVEEYFIIGGAEIYKLFIDRVDAVYITEIRKKFSGDAFFDFKFDGWNETSISHQIDPDSSIGFDIRCLERPSAQNARSMSSEAERVSNGSSWAQPYELLHA